jgi:dTDP-4-dehydrorhamnose 3,5-epimerase-like enzyme
MVYVPGDCGHGFQTLDDDNEVVYVVSRSTHSSAGDKGPDPAVEIINSLRAL